MIAVMKRGQRGFSLIELLVAFAIMALSLGLIYKAMGASARNAGDMVMHQQASMLADALLSTRDSVIDQGWNESGISGAFAWRVNSQPFLSPGNSAVVFPLHEIDVNVSWQDGMRQRQLEVKTLLPQRKPVPGDVIR